MSRLIAPLCLILLSCSESEDADEVITPTDRTVITDMGTATEEPANGVTEQEPEPANVVFRKPSSVMNQNTEPN